MKIPFQCHRCLLLVEMEERAFDLHNQPAGWELVQRKPKSFRFDWRCSTCVREVAAGSPAELGKADPS